MCTIRMAIRLVKPRSHHIYCYFLLITAQNQNYAVSLSIYSSSADCRLIPHSIRGRAIVNILIFFRFKPLANCGSEERTSMLLPSSSLVPYHLRYRKQTADKSEKPVVFFRVFPLMDDCFKTKMKKPLGLRNNAQAKFMCALRRKLKRLSTIILSQLLLRRSTIFFVFFVLFFIFFFSLWAMLMTFVIRDSTFKISIPRMTDGRRNR